MVLGMVQTWELFSRLVLAPSYRFSFGIYEDPVGAPFLDKLLLLPTVSYRSLRSGRRLLVLRQ